MMNFDVEVVVAYYKAV